MPDLNSYVHAMEIDQETGKPMEKVAALLEGSTLIEQKTQADTVGGNLTFSDKVETIEIYNTDETNNGVFNINGINVIVPKGDVFKSRIGGVPSQTVSISGSSSYIITRYA